MPANALDILSDAFSRPMVQKLMDTPVDVHKYRRLIPEPLQSRRLTPSSIYYQYTYKWTRMLGKPHYGYEQGHDTQYRQA